MSNDLLQTIHTALPAEAWPEPEQPLIVAVSGGADSMALLHLLAELDRQQGFGWRLHAAHLDHGLRPESRGDAEFVQRGASAGGWGCTIETRPIRDLATAAGIPLEECGRDERYAFFERVLEATGGEVVATAHHADDNAETILQRLLRGTGLRGLAGIPPVRRLGSRTPLRVIRPLLHLRRTQLLAYLKDRGLAWRADASNDVLEINRNRIRHELIPHLEADYNPAVVEALLRLGQQSRWTVEHMQEVVERRLADVALEIGERAITFSAKALFQQPRPYRTELVRRAIAVLGCGEKKLSFQHLLAVVDLAGRKVSGKRLELPGRLTVTKIRDRLRLERTGVEPCPAREASH